jgi:hypothetical protein
MATDAIGQPGHGLDPGQPRPGQKAGQIDRPTKVAGGRVLGRGVEPEHEQSAAGQLPFEAVELAENRRTQERVTGAGDRQRHAQRDRLGGTARLQEIRIVGRKRGRSQREERDQPRTAMTDPTLSHGVLRASAFRPRF